MTQQGSLSRVPALVLVVSLVLWIGETDAFGVGIGAARSMTTMGMGNSFGRLFRISTWGESHGGGVGVNLDGCPPKIPLTAQDIQVGTCLTSICAKLVVCACCSDARDASWYLACSLPNCNS